LRIDLLCNLISQSCQYVKVRLDRDTTITVKGLECYILSLDTFIKPIQPFYGTLDSRHNKKVYCFYAEDNNDLGIKKAQFVKEYTGISKGIYYA
jgi:hypothetical protein